MRWNLGLLAVLSVVGTWGCAVETPPLADGALEVVMEREGQVMHRVARYADGHVVGQVLSLQGDLLEEATFRDELNGKGYLVAFQVAAQGDKLGHVRIAYEDGAVAVNVEQARAFLRFTYEELGSGKKKFDGKGCDSPMGTLTCTDAGGCCDVHDDCFSENNCSALSWFLLNPFTLAPATLLSACARCNEVVVACFARSAAGFGPGPSTCCKCGDCGIDWPTNVGGNTYSKGIAAERGKSLCCDGSEPKAPTGCKFGDSYCVGGTIYHCVSGTSRDCTGREWSTNVWDKLKDCPARPGESVGACDPSGGCMAECTPGMGTICVQDEAGMGRIKVCDKGKWVDGRDVASSPINFPYASGDRCNSPFCCSKLYPGQCAKDATECKMPVGGGTGTGTGTGGDGGGTGDGKSTCFMAGTPVAMADGSTKAIEDIHVGDFVVGYDELTGLKAPHKVSETFHHTRASDPITLVNGRLSVTGNHPFFANGKWVRADELKLGDHLITLSGTTDVMSLATRNLDTPPVFNIEVDDVHTYFAGGTLVHNYKWIAGGGTGIGTGTNPTDGGYEYLDGTEPKPDLLPPCEPGAAGGVDRSCTPDACTTRVREAMPCPCGNCDRPYWGQSCVDEYNACMGICTSTSGGAGL